MKGYSTVLNDCCPTALVPNDRTPTEYRDRSANVDGGGGEELSIVHEDEEGPVDADAQIPYRQYPLQGGVSEHEATSHNDSIVELKCEMSCDLAMCAENLVHNVPNTVEELKKRSVWPEWEAAIASEMDALTRNQASTLSELPPGRKAIDCQWVFKLKHGVEGGAIRLDCWQGNQQASAEWV